MREADGPSLDEHLAIQMKLVNATTGAEWRTLFVNAPVPMISAAA